MAKVFEWILDKSYYIGFFLSAVMGLVVFQISGNSVKSLESTMVIEEKIRVLTKTNYLINRATSLISVAITTGNINLFKSGITVQEAALNYMNKALVIDRSLLDHYAPILNQHHQWVLNISKRWSNGKEIKSKEVVDLSNRTEEIGQQLNTQEAGLWGKYISSQSSLIKHQTKYGQLIKFLNYFLSIFLFILMVITQRKKNAEKTIKRSERLHQTLVASLSEGILLVNMQGTIMAFNDSALILLGLKKSDLVGRNLNSLFPNLVAESGKDLGGDDSPFNKALKNGRPIQNLFAGIRLAGFKLRWLNFNTQPMAESEDGSIFSTVISFSDLTEKVEAQRTILKQQEKIINSSKMSALGKMAGGIAHEINNPLAIISAHADDLIESASENDGIPSNLAQKVGERIVSTTKRIARIIKGLRTFARDGDTDQFKMIKISDIIDDVVGLSQEKFKNNSIKLTVSDIEPELEIYCNETQIVQVLINLLNNASDAIETLNEKWIKIEINNKSHHLELSITDSGAGIPSEIRDKILEPFFTTKEIGKGTGLGLSISKGIIEGHKGTFSIDPKCPNTKFVITLPKKEIDSKRPKLPKTG